MRLMKRSVTSKDPTTTKPDSLRLEGLRERFKFHVKKRTTLPRRRRENALPSIWEQEIEG